MSAENFLEGLRKFIERRGKPDKIISDNTTYFKADKKTIDMVWKNSINDTQLHSYLSEKRI